MLEQAKQLLFFFKTNKIIRNEEWNYTIIEVSILINYLTIQNLHASTNGGMKPMRKKSD
jgi:hypothetical protein